MTDEEPTPRKSVEKSRAGLANATAIVVSIRENAMVQQLISSFKESARFQIDEVSLSDELATVLRSSALKKFQIDGPDGLSTNMDKRFELQGGRERVVTINRDLRPVLLAAKRVWRTGLVFVRALPEVAGLTQKAVEDIASLVFLEVRDTIDVIESLMEETKEVMQNLDDRTKLLDEWFSMHKQHVFLTLAHKGRANGNKEGYVDENTPYRSARRYHHND